MHILISWTIFKKKSIYWIRLNASILFDVLIYATSGRIMNAIRFHIIYSCNLYYNNKYFRASKQNKNTKDN